MKSNESEQFGNSSENSSQSHLTLLHTLKGHEYAITGVAWSRRVLASGSGDGTISLWDGQSGQHISTLEGHTEVVSCISFSKDGRLLASKSDDGTVRIWRTGPWEMLEILEEESLGSSILDVTFHPQAPILATLGKYDTVIRIWDVDVAALLGTAPANCLCALHHGKNCTSRR